MWQYLDLVWKKNEHSECILKRLGNYLKLKAEKSTGIKSGHVLFQSSSLKQSYIYVGAILITTNCHIRLQRLRPIRQGIENNNSVYQKIFFTNYTCLSAK